MNNQYSMSMLWWVVNKQNLRDEDFLYFQIGKNEFQHFKCKLLSTYSNSPKNSKVNQMKKCLLIVIFQEILTILLSLPNKIKNLQSKIDLVACIASNISLVYRHHVKKNVYIKYPSQVSSLPLPHTKSLRDSPRMEPKSQKHIELITLEQIWKLETENYI